MLTCYRFHEILLFGFAYNLLKSNNRVEIESKKKKMHNHLYMETDNYIHI